MYIHHDVGMEISGKLVGVNSFFPSAMEVLENWVINLCGTNLHLLSHYFTGHKDCIFTFCFLIYVYSTLCNQVITCRNYFHGKTSMAHPVIFISFKL